MLKIIPGGEPQWKQPKYMKDFLKGIPWKKTLLVFLIWRIGLFAVAAIAPQVINIFGDRFPYKELLIDTGLPYWVWPFGNFDGVHYLGIAANGYAAQYVQTFFPLYPLLIKILTLNGDYLLTALVLSNTLFLISLIFLIKLYNLDFDKRISFLSMIFLISIPTAFFFGSVYTESLFLLLSLISIYLSRKKKFVISGIFTALASATRIIGLCLIPLILIEIYQEIKQEGLTVKKTLRYILSLVIAPLGTIAYMVYLKVNFNNPFYFLTAQPAFGAQRSSKPVILLLQVIYRYIKIFISVPFHSLSFFNASLEFLSTLVPILMLVVLFKRIRFSYWIFVFLSLILPTMTGTFSSMPRYALMSFLLFPTIIVIFEKYYKPLTILFFVLQIVFASLFLRGYWIA